MKLKKRIAALMAAGAMICSALPVNVLAEEIPKQNTGGLCEHHQQHTAECRYTEGVPGTPCAHEHSEDCFIIVTNCVHEHTQESYPTESNEEATEATEPAQATACTHECSEESGCITKELDCKHEHDSECGYSPTTDGTPCHFVCEICNPQDGENADLTQCAGEKADEQVKAVQEQIDALPTMEELAAMTAEEQREAHEKLEAAYKAYNALTDEQKAQITGAEIFESLFVFFNSNSNTLAEDTGGFTVTGGMYGVDYEFVDGELRILTNTELTITTNGNPIAQKIKGLTKGLTYNLVFNNLYLNGQDNANHIELYGHVNLTILGTNKIDVMGIGLTAGSLTITSDSTGSLDIKGTDSDALWVCGSGSNNANLIVNGGSLTYNYGGINGTISTSGTGTINGKKYEFITITYLDADGNEQTPDNVSVIDDNSTMWGSGWYVVNSDVTMDSRVTVNGDVHLILADGYSLNAENGGINVGENQSLTIYGQIGRTGKLTAEGGEKQAGIGSDLDSSGGSITINGGNVTATGGLSGAGIGSGSAAPVDGGSGHGSGGNITINGGNVTATGVYGGAGIGGGNCCSGGNITINGGNVIATGNVGGAGIGGGPNGIGGSIAINGGNVTAKGGEHGAGIGGGMNSRGGDITITGGSVNAAGGINSGSGKSYTGIGDGGYASGSGSSTFSTGKNGNAFIITDSISDQSNKHSWSGVIFEGDNGGIYGDQTLQEDLEIESNQTLTIGDNSTLTIPDGVTLTVENGATLTNNGMITGSGTLDGEGNLEGSGTIAQTVTNRLQKDSAVSVSVNPSNAAYGSTVTITATMSKATNTFTRAAENQVEFFVGTDNNKKSLGTANVNGDTATLSDVEISKEKGFTIGRNTITAEYGGSMGLKENSSTESLTVNPIQLSAPQNPKWNNNVPGKATWGVVENASGYSVQLYKDGTPQGEAVSVTGTSYTFAVAEAGNYSFKVKATGTDIYANSEETESGSLSFYAITFETNGGSTIPAQVVAENGKATAPTEPTKTGHTFGGWYSDEKLITPYDFNNTVSKDTVIYAKWTAVPQRPDDDSSGNGSSDSGNGGSSSGNNSSSDNNNSNATVDKEEEDYNDFWDKVIDRINKADEGDTVTVHAGDYDKMPNKVMKALEKNGVGLIIKYNGGEIEIPAGEAVNKSNKLFWSFKELGNYVFAVEDNNEQNNDKQDNEQSNGSENNTQSNTQTEQKPSGTVETKPNPQTGSEDYVGLAAALAVTAGVAAIGLGKKKK